MAVRTRAMASVECLFAITTIIVLSCCSCDNNAFFVEANSSGFISGKFSSAITSTPSPSIAFLVPRGGDVSNNYDSEYDFDSDEEEEEEEIVPVKTKLSSSTLKASSKAKNRKVQTSKKIVNESLSKKKKTASTAVKKASWKKSLYIPYILRAMFNPFIVVAMTKGYFASLFNIDYLDFLEKVGFPSISNSLF